MIELLVSTGMLGIYQDSSSLTVLKLDTYLTLFIAAIIYVIGKLLVDRLPILKNYTIPASVAGGLLAATIFLILHQYDITFEIDGTLQQLFMLSFFASIGLSANLAKLKAGGKLLLKFFVIVLGLLFLQNAIGVGLATAFDLNPLIGLLTGSVTLSGGHGTGGAWGAVFTNKYGFIGATEVAMACATFGLVLGGIIGGPVARFIIRHSSTPDGTPDSDSEEQLESFAKPAKERAMTAGAIIRGSLLIISCIIFGSMIDQLLKDTYFELPTFVCVLFVGVVLSNTLPYISNYKKYSKTVAVLGDASLSLFVVMALMGLKLWHLASLAMPILVILIVQTIAMILYAMFITYRFMGKNYDAAVISAGHCGFGLGATPTAVANMQSVTDRFGPSQVAFLIVPMVGAFFIDIANAIVIKLFLELPIMPAVLTAVGQ